MNIISTNSFFLAGQIEADQKTNVEKRDKVSRLSELPDSLQQNILEFLDKGIALDELRIVNKEWRDIGTHLKIEREKRSLKEQYEQIQNEFLPFVVKTIKELKSSGELASDAGKLEGVYQQIARLHLSLDDLSSLTLEEMQLAVRKLKEKVIEILKNLEKVDLIELADKCLIIGPDCFFASLALLTVSYKTLEAIDRLENINKFNRALILSDIAGTWADLGEIDQALLLLYGYDISWVGRDDIFLSIAMKLLDNNKIREAEIAAREISMEKDRSKVYPRMAQCLATNGKFIKSMQYVLKITNEGMKSFIKSGVEMHIKKQAEKDKEDGSKKCQEILDRAQKLENRSLSVL